jgi:hypothetical protein
MTTKLRIDLTQGILEVEGSETFVKAIYRDFKAQFIQGESSGEDELEPQTKRRRRRTTRSKAKADSNKPAPAEAAAPPSAPKPEIPPATPEAPLPAPKVTEASPTYSRVKDLDLAATADHPSLGEFMDSKLPITNEERNLVFMYYLQHMLNLESISIDHIYTCYREVKIRAPLNLEQSLQTTANQKGWIGSGDNGDLAVTPEGKLYVEKQLPKKVK